MGKEFKLGEIYWIKLSGKGSVQNGWHPAIVIQNDIGNKFSSTISIIPITSAKKTNLPTHINIKAGKFGLKKDSIIQCEGQQLVSKNDIGSYVGKVDKLTLKKISKCCLINTPFLMFLNEDDIVNLKKKNNEIKGRRFS